MLMVETHAVIDRRQIDCGFYDEEHEGGVDIWSWLDKAVWTQRGV